VGADQRAARIRKLSWLFILDGAGTGVHAALLAVIVAQRYSVAAAGLVGIGYAGRVVALAVARRFDHLRLTSARLASRFSWWCTAMVLVSLTSLACAAVGPVVFALAGNVVYIAANTVTSSLAISLAPDEQARMAPIAITGQVIGAAVATIYVISPGWPVALLAAVVVLAQLAEPLLLAGFTFPAVHKSSAGNVGSALWHAGLLSFLSYGPLAIYPVLVIMATGPVWVVPAMVIYCAGGLCAARVSAWFPSKVGWPGILLLSAAGVLTWALAINVPGLLIGRFLSGVVLFIAQGQMYRQLIGDGTSASISQSSLVAVSLGLGLGCGLGAVVVAPTAQLMGVPAMGCTFAAAGMLCAAVAYLSERQRSTRRNTSAT
jgi:hypothetical protein